jgi:hypothetical protein
MNQKVDNKQNDSLQKGEWYCKKCDQRIPSNIDMDYHENTVHPNMDNFYVRAWYARGCPGISPYD